MGTREILTLQLGHYSNFIGTHWWNLQETNFSYDPKNPSEINPDVLYREGENLKKQFTFTPRLLLVDLKGSLGYLPERGDLYEVLPSVDETDTLWEDVKIEEDPKESKTPFIKSLDEPQENAQNYDLEAECNKWVDYLIPRFHPRTVKVIEEYKHECTTKPFDIFHCGLDVWNSSIFNSDFQERIRLYVEECDLMQGFQVLLDSMNGFAGLGASCVQHLRDEYGKSILTFPVLETNSIEPSASDLVKAVNTALCWDQIGEHSSLFSPLCCGEIGWLQPGESRKFEHVIYDQSKKYHSSAILATALDTITLRYRHRKYPMSAMSDLCADLNKMGRKAAATSLTLPFPLIAKKDLIDVLDDFEGPLWTSLTPACEIGMDKSMQSLALRGIPETSLKRPVHEAGQQMAKAAYRCSSVHEMMSLYLACSCHASATYLTTVQEALQIKDPYPKILKSDLHLNENIRSVSASKDVMSVPVMAGLHSNSNIVTMFDSLHKQVSRVRNIKRLHAFTTCGLEQDEFVETINRLLDLKEAYEEQYI